MTMLMTVFFFPRDTLGNCYFLRAEISLKGATYLISFSDTDQLPPPFRIDNLSDVRDFTHTYFLMLIDVIKQCLVIQSLQTLLRTQLINKTRTKSSISNKFLSYLSTRDVTIHSNHNVIQFTILGL